MKIAFAEIIDFGPVGTEGDFLLDFRSATDQNDDVDARSTFG